MALIDLTLTPMTPRTKEFRHTPIGEELFSPELAATVRKSLEALYPLCRYCQTFADIE